LNKKEITKIRKTLKALREDKIDVVDAIILIKQVVIESEKKKR
jgi:hypothetical protein